MVCFEIKGLSPEHPKIDPPLSIIHSTSSVDNILKRFSFIPENPLRIPTTEIFIVLALITTDLITAFKPYFIICFILEIF